MNAVSKIFLSLLLSVPVGFVSGIGSSHAQDVFNLPSNNDGETDENGEQTDNASSNPIYLPSVNPPTPEEENAPNTSEPLSLPEALKQVPEGSIKNFDGTPMNFPKGTITEKELREQMIKEPSEETKQRIKNLQSIAASTSTQEIAAKMGIPPDKYNQYKAAFSKANSLYPQIPDRSANPFVLIEFMGEAKKYQIALSNYLSKTCGLTGAGVIFDTVSFSRDEKLKQNINTKLIQPMGAVLNALCSDADVKKDFNELFIMLRIINDPSVKDVNVESESGVFSLSADFSNATPITVSIARDGFLKGLKTAKELRDNPDKQAEFMKKMQSEVSKYGLGPEAMESPPEEVKESNQNDESEE